MARKGNDPAFIAIGAATPTPDAPEGYVWAGAADGVAQFFTCCQCGALVGDWVTHNAWHMVLVQHFKICDLQFRILEQKEKVSVNADSAPLPIVRTTPSGSKAYGFLAEGECAFCDQIVAEFGGFGPSHGPRNCASSWGVFTHCTCDSCW